MNKLPRIYNADTATWNRMMPFKYVRVFLDKEVYDKLSDNDKREKTEEELKEGKLNYGIKDITMINQLTLPSEMSGFLNKSLKGLIRYLLNGGFSYARGVDEVRNEWIRISDSFMAFCIDNIEAGDPNEDFVIKKDMATRYHKYCSKHKILSVGDKSIKATLSSQYGVYVDADVKKHTVDMSSDWIRVWEGIKWKNDKYKTL